MTTKTNVSNAVLAFIVHNENGTINLQASDAKFHTHAVQFMAEYEADQEFVGQSLTKLYDQHKGAQLNQDFIVSQLNKALLEKHPEMKDPQSFVKIKARILDYLKDNSGDNKTYTMKLGAGGGYYRTADRQTTSV